MFCTFSILLAIELTLFVNKPDARVFAGTIVAVGLLMQAIPRIVQNERPPQQLKNERQRHRSNRAQNF